MNAATSSLLAVSNVTKCFGRVIALEDVSMSVYTDRVTCLLGDNGAGKSTLIKVLAGVHKPSAGRYEVGGEAVEPSSLRSKG